VYLGYFWLPELLFRKQKATFEPKAAFKKPKNRCFLSLRIAHAHDAPFLPLLELYFFDSKRTSLEFLFKTPSDGFMPLR